MPRNPSFAAVFTTAYRDLLNVWRAMRGFVLAVLGIMIVLGIAEAIIPAMFTNRFVGVAVKLAIIVVTLYFTAPFFIAVHRFILFGEVARHYSFGLDAARRKIFFRWMLFFGLLEFIQLFLHFLSAGLALQLQTQSVRYLSWIFMIQMAIFMFIPRVIVLFPAIAAGAPGTSLDNAWNDTKGRTWFLILGTAVILLPILALFFVTNKLLSAFPLEPGSLSIVVMTVRDMPLWLAALILTAVFATRCFTAFGDRLNQRPFSTDASGPKFGDVAIVTYWDMGWVVRKLWGAVLIVCATVIAYPFLSKWLSIKFAYYPVAAYLAGVLVGVLAILLLTPLFVAMHRLIMFGETDWKYQFALSEKRTRKYFLALSAFWLALCVPGLLYAFGEPVGLVFYTVSGTVNTGPHPAIIFIVRVAIIMLCARLALLPSAIAADAPGVGIANAWADTAGRTAYVVIYPLLVGIPCMVATAAVGFIASLLPRNILVALPMFSILVGIFVIALILCISLASRAYMAFGEKLNEPSGTQP
jgi:hypothetical protein